MATLDRLYYHEAFLLLFSHKLAWWRYLLCFVISSVYCSQLVGRLGSDWMLLGPGFAGRKYLDLLLVVLCLLNRVIWSYLFRDPNGFLRFRRPSKGYRRAICALSCFCVLPSLLLHIPLFVLRGRTGKRHWLGPLTQLMSYFALVSCFLWMVKRFLLREDDAHYEPTIGLSASIDAVPYDFPRAALPEYSDESHLGSPIPSFSSQTLLTPVGYLDTAYSAQPALGTPASAPTEDYGASSLCAVQTRRDVDASPVVDGPNTNTSRSSHIPHSRCPTLALFDYLPQGRIGPHSWFSWPLVSMVLGSVNTLFCILDLVLNYENTKARVPSS